MIPRDSGSRTRECAQPTGSASLALAQGAEALEVGEVLVDPARRLFHRDEVLDACEVGRHAEELANHAAPREMKSSAVKSGSKPPQRSTARRAWRRF